MNDFLKLVWSNESQCAPLYKVGPYERNTYIFHYIVSGKGWIEYLGRRFEASAGQIFLVYKGENISYGADGTHPWRYIWADFDGSAVDELLSQTGFSADVRVSPVLEAEKIYPIFVSFVDKFGSDASELDGSAALLSLFAELVREFPAQSAPRAGTAERAAQLIRTGFHDSDCRVEKIADMVGISRSRLFRLFKERFGMGPKEYLDGCRLRRAKELLKGNDLTVAEVGYSSGYSDPLYFSAEFKRKTGMSPKKYRERSQKR